MSWPCGQSSFDVDALIEAGRALDRAVAHGDPVAVGEATDTVDALAEYVASLPETIQAETSRRLVVALAERKRFAATVTPKPRAAAFPKTGESVR